MIRFGLVFFSFTFLVLSQSGAFTLDYFSLDCTMTHENEELDFNGNPIGTVITTITTGLLKADPASYLGTEGTVTVRVANNFGGITDFDIKTTELMRGFGVARAEIITEGEPGYTYRLNWDLATGDGDARLFLTEDESDILREQKVNCKVRL